MQEVVKYTKDLIIIYISNLYNRLIWRKKEKKMKRKIAVFVAVLTLAAVMALGLIINASAQEPTVEASISLAENITVAFKVNNLPSDAKAAEITLPTGEVITSEVASAESSAGARLFYAEVPIKFYDRAVTLDILTASGVSVLQSPVTYSVKDYCDGYSGTEFNALVSALKTYGSAAYTYFSKGNAEAPAEAPDLSEFDGIKILGSLSGIKHRSATLILESETTVRHYFELAEGSDINDYTFYVDYNLNEIFDFGEELTPSLHDGGLYYIDISGISPNDLDRAYNLYVTGAGSDYMCAYGAMTYAKRSYEGGSTALKSLISGMHGYWRAADGLEGGITLKNDDGTSFASYKYEYGIETPIVPYTVPTSKIAGRESWGFIGWYDASGNKVDTVYGAQTGDISLTAKFKDTTIGSFKFANVAAVTQNYWRPHTHTGSGSTLCTVCGHKSSCSVSAAAGKYEASSSRSTCSECGIAYKQSVTVHSGNSSTNYASLIITRDGTAVTYDYDYFQPSNNRISATASGKFYDTVIAAGVRNASFTVGLKSVAGKAALPTTMRIDGNKTNLFYISAQDNTVYFGGMENEGKSEYALFTLSDSEMKTLKIDIDLANVKDSLNGTYTVSAVSEDGRRLSAEYNVETLEIRFCQLSLGGYDAKTAVVGGSYGITLDTPRWSYSTSSLNYVLPGDIGENYSTEYTPGVSSALADEPAVSNDLASIYNGYFFDMRVFRGWFLDEECTQPITSVPANASGPLLIYSKWEVKTDAELEEERQAGIDKFKEIINGITTEFADIPAFPTTYTAKILPNTQHPRVMVNSEGLPALRANVLAAENAENYQKVVALAVSTLESDGRLSHASGSDPTNYTSAASSGIEALAFLYLITDNEYFGYAAISYALNFLDTVHFPDQLHGSNEEYEDANKAGTAIYILAEVYDWCYDLLTKKEQDQLIRGICEKLSTHIEMGCPPDGLGAITGHGTSVEILRDWLSVAIAVYGEHPEIYDYIIGRIENEYVAAPNWYYQSGANFQGSAYGLNKTYCHMLSDMLVYTMSGKHLYSVDLEPVVMTMLNQIRPDGEIIRMGDDYNQINKGSTYSTGNMARLAFYGAANYGIPAAKAWFREWTNDYSSLTWSSRMEMTPIVFLLLNDPELPSDAEYKYSALNLVHYNGSPTGAITARSAWGDEAAWLTFTNIDECYGANHDHKDAGTFQIYYKGILALNSTAYQYDSALNGQYGSLMDFSYVKQTISKNGLLIYNPKYEGTGGKWTYSGGQTTQGSANSENMTLEGWFDKTTSHQATELGHSYGYDNDGNVKYAYISGDITNAYDADTVDLVMRSTMSIATGDAEHPLMFIVHDRIISDNAGYKKTFLLHTTDEPTLISGENAFYYTNTRGVNGTADTSDDLEKYNGMLTNTTLLPKSYNYEAIGGDGKRIWINGESFGDDSNIADYSVLELGWGRVELSPSVASKDDSFLNVMYVGDADGDITYIKPTLVESATHEGAVSFGSCVMFSRSNEKTSNEISFTAEAAGELNYYVGGLSAGVWQIKVDGAVLGTAEVDAAGGIAVFKAPAGEVTLSPSFTSIKYEAAGGAFADGYTAPESVLNGEGIALPNASQIERFGYDFDGWYTSPDYTGERLSSVFADGSTTSITLYAKWVRAFGVISYNTNGGEIIGEYTVENRLGSKVTLPTAVSRGNDSFVGWYTDNVYTSKISEIPAESDADITLYALFRPSGARWQAGSGSAGYEYYFGTANGGWTGGNIGSELKALDESKLTLRIDTASTGSANWTDGAIRMRRGYGGSDVNFVKFIGGNMVSGVSSTVLTSANSGDIIDFVIDFNAQTVSYYVNGVYKTLEAYSGISRDLTYYNYETSPIAGQALVRGNLFQLTNTDSVGRVLAKDGAYIYMGECVYETAAKHK